jgi:phospholipid/cholesterol/gamma-HCH transport system ATP-binding protein
LIEYRRLYKSFDVPVLKGVDLTVETGETVSIVGPSGCGKSVLLKTTIGLIVPDRGDVRIDGESVFWCSKDALERIRRKVSYVFQNAALFDSLSVGENVALGIREDRVDRREQWRRAAGALEKVNLDPAEVLNKLPADLSGGMRKRVGLARAIVGQPRIILYDEPVTGLDPVNSANVARLIAGIADGTGVTTVVVTHDIEGALGISDRIALLHGGRLRFVGTPGAFRSSGDPVVKAFGDRAAAAAASVEGFAVLA